nr:hypothetical protein [Tanacetum cinerariifolium]
MISKHYKHLTKKQKKTNQAEKMFVVKASTMKLGATRAHNLYSSMKGGAQYVHGTSDDFKSHIRDVNAFICESNAQMLINKMKNRKKFVPNFAFQYKVENSELVAMFWADEVDKCNYKEFGDIISFDATFLTNKYDMPTIIVTDQDGAMKLAIEEVLTKSKHRQCMWHIMQKIPAKMTKMFNLREMWLPAYFIDSPLFGLMRTTSRSESENAFFKSFTNHGSTLVNFKMCFESAMERQRYRQEILDFKTFDSAPKIHTKLKIKIHASKVYTRTIFLLVQNEIIKAVWACQILECKTEEGCEIVKVRDKRASAYSTLNTNKEKEVVQQKEYVVEYKRRDIIPPALRRNKNRYGEKNETIEKLTNKANYVVDECLFLLSKDEGMLETFVKQLKTIKQEVQVQVLKPLLQKTCDVIEDIYVIEKTQQNDVNNPQRARNKGGRRGERRKSGREIALKAKTKQIQKCLYCEEKTNKHTKSTCPSNPKYVAKLARLVVAAAAKQGTTTAGATEQETTTAIAGEQAATAATDEAMTTASVSKEATNAS